MTNTFLPYIKHLPEIFISFISALLLTPIVGYLANKFRVVDLPASQRGKNDSTAWRRVHTETKLRLGGVAVIIPFIILTLIYLHVTPVLIGFLFAVLLLLICGVIDDVNELSSKIQALFHISAAIIVVLLGIQITTLSNPFGQAIDLTAFKLSFVGISISLAAAVTVIWIFFIINAVKWVSGTDGLVEGNAAIAAIIIGLLSIRFQTNPTAIMSFIFAGALLGFLPYNFYPSKILSSSAGKSVYGFILAVLAIYSGGKLATFILTLSLPIIDAIWVILYRIKKHKPKTIFQLFAINDKSHIHHKLLEMGFNQKQVAYIEYTYTLVVGTIAFLFTGLHKAFALSIAIIFLILIYIFIAIKLKKKKDNA